MFTALRDVSFHLRVQYTFFFSSLALAMYTRLAVQLRPRVELYVIRSTSAVAFVPRCGTSRGRSYTENFVMLSATVQVSYTRLYMFSDATISLFGIHVLFLNCTS